jgi:Fe-S-cluster-containing hydrogenase component 2
MDKIALLEKFADQFGDRDNISFDKQRCARIRNARSKCQACTQICPHDAIKIAGRSFFVDQTACTGCGACVTVCPLGVFSLTNEPYLKTATRLIASVEATEGKPIIACERALESLRREVDQNKVVPVRCLDSIDEGLVLGTMALGASEVVFCHDECSTCDIGTGGTVWEVVAESANYLADQWGFLPFVCAASTMPAAAFEITKPDVRNAYDSSKREMFTSLRDSAVGFFGHVAGDALNGMGLGSMGLEQLAESLKERSPILKAFDTSRPMVVCSALYALGEPEVSSIESRFWGTISVDNLKCRGCVMCGVYCPTGALVKKGRELEDGLSIPGVEFTPRLCAQCNLCQDACRFTALKFDPRVDAAILNENGSYFIDINRA